MSQWTAYYTAEGKPYYHNHFTDATQWTKPDDMSDMPAPEAVGKPTEMPKALGGSIAPPTPIKLFYFWDVSWVASLFDTTTTEVSQRVLVSALPYVMKESTTPMYEKPDLWGPFWLCETASILLFFCSNINRYLNDHIAAALFRTEVLSHVMVFCFWGFTSVAAYLVGVLVNHQNDSAESTPVPSLSTFLGITGYAMVWTIPFALVAAFPLGWLRNLLAFVLGCSAAIAVIRNVARGSDFASLPRMSQITTLALCAGVFAYFMCLPAAFYSG
ncbi:MAG: hypothetical protein KVP17_002389 [Porospora cf. gigantea B]|uniref:uncharacterized protein n=1 Tax=Porospora cf. gigantea B TaxID=2853592 RepID=UPI003571DA21|nr:MAG: hypothetical protein KVP17_002389 [Porospora cf. gigantea B]